MCRYQLPYWAFVPTLGVWPRAAASNGSRGTVTVNVDNGEVIVDDAARSNVATISDPVTTSITPEATDIPKHRIPIKHQIQPNTPSIGGPSWLRKTTSTLSMTKLGSVPSVTQTKQKDTVAVTATRPVTKIYLKPSARAKAGKGGVALSNPISTAVVRRGDTVSIEYLPDATAEAGDGGVAISRPELVIHLVD